MRSSMRNLAAKSSRYDTISNRMRRLASGKLVDEAAIGK